MNQNKETPDYELALKLMLDNLDSYRKKYRVRTTTKEGEVSTWATSYYSIYEHTDDWLSRYEIEKINASYLEERGIIRVEKLQDEDWVTIWESRCDVISDPNTLLLVNGNTYTLSELSEILRKLKEIKLAL